MKAETTRTNFQKVGSYYENAEQEWNRLQRHPLEFPVTTGVLEKYLPERGSLLDIGGGPGRYAIHYALKGYEVTLFDLSSHNVEFANHKAKEWRAPVRDFLTGNATDLAQFESDQFDIVLNFGPLYHLTQEEERVQAVEEAVRVLKPGGVIAVAFISAYSPIFDTLKHSPAAIQDLRPRLKSYLSEGVYIRGKDGGFVDAYFMRPERIETFMSPFGLEPLSLFGAEGMIVQSEETLVGLEEAVVDEWIDFCKETAELPASVYGSDHAVYVGRKPG